MSNPFLKKPQWGKVDEITITPMPQVITKEAIVTSPRIREVEKSTLKVGFFENFPY